MTPDTAGLPEQEFEVTEPKANELAPSDDAQEVVASVVPIRPGIEVPQAVPIPDQAKGNENYALEYLADQVAAAQTRYDNMERTFHEAQAKDKPPATQEALADLREAADNAYTSLNTWKARLEAAESLQQPTVSESNDEPASSTA